tara:strand:+ start:867 stop:1178 length:312 start_codon:yes stop_codon:yes gene_type:complete
MSGDFGPWYESQSMTFGEIHTMFISQIETEKLKHSLSEGEITIILIEVINEYYEKEDKESVLINDFDYSIELTNFGSVRGFMTFYYRKLWDKFVEKIRSQDMD